LYFLIQLPIKMTKNKSFIYAIKIRPLGQIEHGKNYRHLHIHSYQQTHLRMS